MNRLYRRAIPNVGEIVRATVVSLDEYGATVSLDDYGREARVLLTDLIRGRLKQSLRRLCPVGSHEYLEVIESTDSYIGCSKKSVTEADRQEATRVSALDHQLRSALRVLSQRSQIPLARLYEEVVWPLQDRDEHPYQVLSSLCALEGAEGLNPDLVDSIRREHAASFGTTYYHRESELELVCYSFGGVADLQRVVGEALASARAEHPEHPDDVGSARLEVGFSVKHLPTYCLAVSGVDEASVKRAHDRVVESLERQLAPQGRCHVKLTTDSTDTRLSQGIEGSGEDVPAAPDRS